MSDTGQRRTQRRGARHKSGRRPRAAPVGRPNVGRTGAEQSWHHGKVPPRQSAGCGAGRGAASARCSAPTSALTPMRRAGCRAGRARPRGRRSPQPCWRRPAPPAPPRSTRPPARRGECRGREDKKAREGQGGRRRVRSTWQLAGSTGPVRQRASRSCWAHPPTHPPTHPTHPPAPPAHLGAQDGAGRLAGRQAVGVWAAHLHVPHLLPRARLVEQAACGSGTPARESTRQHQCTGQACSAARAGQPVTPSGQRIRHGTAREHGTHPAARSCSRCPSAAAPPRPACTTAGHHRSTGISQEAGAGMRASCCAGARQVQPGPRCSPAAQHALPSAAKACRRLLLPQQRPRAEVEGGQGLLPSRLPTALTALHPAAASRLLLPQEHAPVEVEREQRVVHADGGDQHKLGDALRGRQGGGRVAGAWPQGGRPSAARPAWLAGLAGCRVRQASAGAGSCSGRGSSGSLLCTAAATTRNKNATT